jgi:hypothetical protein
VHQLGSGKAQAVYFRGAFAVVGIEKNRLCSIHLGTAAYYSTVKAMVFEVDEKSTLFVGTKTQVSAYVPGASTVLE